MPDNKKQTKRRATRSSPVWRVLFTFGRWYKNISAILLTVILIALLFNGMCCWYYHGKDPRRAKTNPLIRRYGMETMRAVYPEMNDEQIKELLFEVWYRPFSYETFTQFRERPFKGKYINVTDYGVRVVKDQGPWPPRQQNYNIFLLGGSTTFGYNVADDETIGSHLQQLFGNIGGKPVKVYNFGRGYYYSTQERILLEQLLVKGLRPDMAVFIDGINDMGTPVTKSDLAFATESFTGFMGREGKAEKPLVEFLKDQPLNRAAKQWSKMIRHTFKPPKKKGKVDGNAGPGNPKASEKIWNRYLENVKIARAVCDAYKVKCLFVWQPCPSYKYDRKFHHFMLTGPQHAGYEFVGEQIKTHPLGNDFIDLSDMQEGIDKSLYVDAVHYSDEMNMLVAKEIISILKQRGAFTANKGTIPADK